ncbi:MULTISPECIES: HAD family hydrolase [Streptomycetaceae]|uniref:Putative hydrolase n=1 Tax=Streptantibioticus cattleyicolor (strain ATCC 35852 / DSM 46488 / JCM 4925 / NBRC 14057 / NRRL 8057) TaxID=1003195 RepID=F8JNR8_STREN|nr:MULTISPECIES: HAD family hydrolase [Streptomycetaceae]AEW92648.1 putative hydrolase [Streptantibioticus cattleyicolor NRRL 8057 = DSM 46488]MYS57424.1 HAD-IA family hydrolase [Streptomyces sp. SID5468]CCB73003.1 putative hydrolase [Streptantibioticus cattleyicolor NRRL 8057 = DSM 46488]
MATNRQHDGDHGGAVRAALFDVDGTLVDTNYLHAVTWWEAFRQSGYTVPMADIHHSVGMGSDKLVAHLLGDRGDPDRDAQLSAAHKTLYATWFQRLRAFDKAADLLRAVADRGWRVVLASSAGSDELAAMRAALGADDVIHAATGADDVTSSKPAPDLVERALERAGADPEQAVFIGDTVWDVRAAGKAGVACVALLSGGIPPADLTEAGAIGVYRDPAHLLAELDDSPLAR